MKNNQFLFVMTGLLLGSNFYINAQKQSKKPNIIILTADDLGWNDISSPYSTNGNGSKSHQTPNIDRLMTQGMSFTCAYSQQNSAPTRAAMLTGQYANRSGVYNVTSLTRYGNKKKGGVTKEEARIVPPKQSEAIKAETVTFAEMLERNGYETYIFGKVHGWKGDLKKDHGFGHDFSCSKTVNHQGEKLSNYLAYKESDGNWIFDNPVYNKYAQPYTKEYIENNLEKVANGNDPFKLVDAPKHFTDAIGDCVIEQIAKADRNKPMCMWVCFHAIHSAIVGREDLYDKYKKRSSLDARHTDFKYAALTEQMDQTVGRILAALDDPDGDGDTSDSMSDHTIVLFMSDNGGVGERHNNAPLRGAKGMFYEGGIRIPLVIRYPGFISPGSVSEEPVHVIDYYPTLSELTASQIPDKKEHMLDGVSFAPLLTGKQKELEREALYWHFPGYMDDRQVPSSIINKRMGDKRYKLKYSYETEKYELYCLTDDLSETCNLLERDKEKKNLSIATELREDLCRWLKSNPPMKMHYIDSGKEVGMPREL